MAGSDSAGLLRFPDSYMPMGVKFHPKNGKPTHGPYIGIHCATGPRPLRFLRDILPVVFWQMDTVQTHGRIVAPRFFVIPKLDAFEGTFAEEVDDVVPSPG